MEIDITQVPPPGYRPAAATTRPAFSCLRCGALTNDPELHSAWHDELARALAGNR